MRRAFLAILILCIGVVIGSCFPPSRAGPKRPAPPQDWRPVVGTRYERPGHRARTVVETWEKGVRYRWDSGRERNCTYETWRRWAEQRKGGE